MTSTEWGKFAEKVRLAVEASLESHYDRGTTGLEVEFNILDRSLHPVAHVGSGPEQRSFADVLIEERIPTWARGRSQREVFHWMTEVATRPFYDSRGAAWEARLLEALLLDVLAEAGLTYGERFYLLHGNIPHPLKVDGSAIPAGWSLAKKRYLERCVALFGASLATAGIHTNHSLPEALLSWDFFHLPRGQRESTTLETYRSETMIRATRLLRAFCPLFVGISAASPLSFDEVDGRPRMVLTGHDSNRLLTFPNPANLDVPHLYASHADYLRISYGLVRSGARFGGNNWTPVRARSDVDPVNRIISLTTGQLRELYRRGIYDIEGYASHEEAERALIVENICALVDLPMTRVEVRTDEGGDDLDLAVAKTAFKQLLLMRVYAEPEYGAGYTYDDADVARARANEAAAARRGLDAVISHPFTGETVSVREWLCAALHDLAPLADALDYGAAVEPIAAMAGGAPNPAAMAREWFAARLRGGRTAPSGATVVPEELFREWLEARERRVTAEAAGVAASWRDLGDEAGKLAELVQPFEVLARENPALPVRLGVPSAEERIAVAGGVVGDVLALAAALVRIPSVTNCARERVDEVFRCARFIGGWLRDAGADVRLWEGGPYPALLAGFPGNLLAPVTLGGHFDVVEPDPNDSQFEPAVEGDYLWGRGAADMKTVVATDMVWMRRALKAGPPYPACNLLLVGNEENGEGQPFGTPHVLAELHREAGWVPELMLLGERTGERGDELFGQVCTANRGVVRLRVIAKGERAHTGMGSVPRDLVARLIQAREALAGLLPRHLTLEGEGSWRSSATFPFLNVGENGVYNVTADEGALGLEVRPIPEDDIDALLAGISVMCRDLGVELRADVVEGGVACPADNPHLGRLLDAVARVSGRPAEFSRKLAGTSARFAPDGNAVVWGQSGIGPHSRHERHFIPSIEPYLRVLEAFAGSLRQA
jgi:acetylornithine deacetylase/succinyl-diaminopimelate desuccinylase-like protein/gamma-glutamyl:cysteine ligase YbdK (ATP-grasp superfamily)